MSEKRYPVINGLLLSEDYSNVTLHLVVEGKTIYYTLTESTLASLLSCAGKLLAKKLFVVTSREEAVSSSKQSICFKRGDRYTLVSKENANKMLDLELAGWVRV